MSIHQLAMAKSSSLNEAALIAALIMGFGLASLLSFSPESLGEYDEAIINWFIRILVFSVSSSLPAILINFSYGYALKQLAAHNDKNGILRLEKERVIYYSHIAANAMTASAAGSFMIAAGLYLFEILNQSLAIKLVIVGALAIGVGGVLSIYILVRYASIGDWTMEDPMRLFEAIEMSDHADVVIHNDDAAKDGIQLAQQRRTR